MKTSRHAWLAEQPTIKLAQELLGARLIVDGCGGLIVETEAYLGETDRAAHAFAGHQTKRNAALWAAAGTIYIYQMRQYCLLNIITQPAGVPQGVLIRAIEPTQGIPQMQKRRPVALPELASGPGKLTQALGVTLADNLTTLDEGRIHLTRHVRVPHQIQATARVGVPNKGKATTAPLRFVVAGNPFVSGIRRRDIDEQEGGWQHGDTKYAGLHRQ